MSRTNTLADLLSESDVKESGFSKKLISHFCEIYSKTEDCSPNDIKKRLENRDESTQKQLKFFKDSLLIGIDIGKYC